MASKCTSIYTSCLVHGFNPSQEFLHKICSSIWIIHFFILPFLGWKIRTSLKPPVVSWAARTE